jgi:ApeA N-terminal domain 1
VLEDREYEGYWWRPDDDGRKVAGRLSFSQREIRLNLLGAFEELEAGPIADQFHDEARILGITGDGKAVTTERNITLGQSFHFPGFPTASFAHVVLVDAHYERSLAPPHLPRRTERGIEQRGRDVIGLA